MNMNAFTTLLFATLAALFAVVAGAPLEARDVYVPPVLYPHHGTVWYTGQRHNVTWDTSNPPAQITNTLGMVILRKGELFVSSGPGSLSQPLAANFSILLGRIEITVPNVQSGDDYTIVLFGDSGNYSGRFTIL